MHQVKKEQARENNPHGMSQQQLSAKKQQGESENVYLS